MIRLERPLQRTTLEIVARARQDGALRSSLCVAAGLAPKNFHYVMRVSPASTSIRRVQLTLLVQKSAASQRDTPHSIYTLRLHHM